MSAWLDKQKKSSGNLRQFLQERFEKVNPRRELTAEEAKRFAKLETIADIAVRRRKLIAKIDEQIQLAANKDYTPTQHKWVTDEHGNQREVEVAKRVKRWWIASVDGKINLVVRYGSKLLEFAKGKNAIELASEAEVADVLAKVREAAELGELDALIEKQAQFGKRVTQKNK